MSFYGIPWLDRFLGTPLEARALSVFEKRQEIERAAYELEDRFSMPYPQAGPADAGEKARREGKRVAAQTRMAEMQAELVATSQALEDEYVAYRREQAYAPDWQTMSKGLGDLDEYVVEQELTKALDAGDFDAALDLIKGAGHKYLRRIPTGDPKRKWIYVYNVTSKHHGKGPAVGEKIKVAHGDKRGHYEITEAHDGHVTLRHDESGHEMKVEKDHVHEIFSQEHEDAIDAAHKRLARTVEATMRHGTEAQQKKAKAALETHRDKYGYDKERVDVPKPKEKMLKLPSGREVSEKEFEAEQAKKRAAVPEKRIATIRAELADFFAGKKSNAKPGDATSLGTTSRMRQFEGTQLIELEAAAEAMAKEGLAKFEHGDLTLNAKGAEWANTGGDKKPAAEPGAKAPAEKPPEIAPLSFEQREQRAGEIGEKVADAHGLSYRVWTQDNKIRVYLKDHKGRDNGYLVPRSDGTITRHKIQRYDNGIIRTISDYLDAQKAPEGKSAADMTEAELNQKIDELGKEEMRLFAEAREARGTDKHKELHAQAVAKVQERKPYAEQLATLREKKPGAEKRPSEVEKERADAYAEFGGQDKFASKQLERAGDWFNVAQKKAYDAKEYAEAARVTRDAQAKIDALGRDIEGLRDSANAKIVSIMQSMSERLASQTAGYERMGREVAKPEEKPAEPPKAEAPPEPKEYESAARFYGADGKDHHWPKVPGWDHESEQVDALGDTHKSAYQMDDPPFKYVNFDGSDLTLKDPKPGKWSYEVAGEKVSGEFTSEKDIPGILETVGAEIRAKVTAHLDAARGKLGGEGWERLQSGGDLAVSSDLTDDHHVYVNTPDGAELGAGQKVSVTAELLDTGGYETEHMLREETTVSSAEEMQRFAEKFRDKARAHLQKKGHLGADAPPPAAPPPSAAGGPERGAAHEHLGGHGKTLHPQEKRIQNAGAYVRRSASEKLRLPSPKIFANPISLEGPGGAKWASDGHFMVKRDLLDEAAHKAATTDARELGPEAMEKVLAKSDTSIAYHYTGIGANPDTAKSSDRRGKGEAGDMSRAMLYRSADGKHSVLVNASYSPPTTLYGGADAGDDASGPLVDSTGEPSYAVMPLKSDREHREAMHKAATAGPPAPIEKVKDLEGRGHVVIGGITYEVGDRVPGPSYAKRKDRPKWEPRQYSVHSPSGEDAILSEKKGGGFTFGPRGGEERDVDVRPKLATVATPLEAIKPAPEKKVKAPKGEVIKKSMTGLAALADYLSGDAPEPETLDALEKADMDIEQQSLPFAKADDGKPGESLGETSTDELEQTHADIQHRLKGDKNPGLQARAKAIAGELAKRKGGEKMSKGLGGLQDYLIKAGELSPTKDPDGLPKQQTPELGYVKSPEIAGGSPDGGELAGVGLTSGSDNSAPAPGTGQDGLPTGTSRTKQKLSEDDADEEKQFRDRKTALEERLTRKSLTPADIRATCAHEHAQRVSALRKGEPDVRVGGTVHPYSHAAVHGNTDAAVERLCKSEFYSGPPPQLVPPGSILRQSVLCKSEACGQRFTAALTACPHCGEDTVQNRMLPTSGHLGATGRSAVILEKSGQSLLRPPPQEPDLYIPGRK
jgi:hypothetical protein